MYTEHKWTSVEKILFVVNVIPVGKVLPYGKVADLAGLPGRARYVSRALKLAPIEANLPWHRVINSAGKISFPPNSDLFQKQTELLRLEDIEVNQGNISLSKYLWQPDIATLVMTLPF
ncbi:MGMT family protein [Shewanella subflava]|uniref:MGMT family protein n=1 Tax=Shewanella subflava TaxID=2986476 RepID=A0ABT3I7K6_9GAMM|nr:MGMT family protein [Shewanella subflava]MCW3172042.1 MGMT family protein [Shewanella subflava]